MKPFNISRIHTTQGIFQLSGHHQGSDLHINKMAMMGTDGWIILDLQQTAVVNLIADLNDKLIEHLNL